METFKRYFIVLWFFGVILGLTGCATGANYTQNYAQKDPCTWCNQPGTIAYHKLDPMLTEYGVHYVYFRKKLVIVVPTLVLFAPTESTLKPQAYPALDMLVKYLQQYPDANILVAGNASPIVDTKLFEKGKISLARAKIVAKYFKCKGIVPGCSNRQLLYTSYGAKYPIATNEKNSGLTRNRRIQILVYPCNTLPYSGKKPPKVIFHHW
jgi:outer membrane protein OmpA-like peptidoglycan-associated protein